MKRIVLIVLFLLLFIITNLFSITIINPGNGNRKIAVVKIFMVHSYNYKHICTSPQRDGFVETLKRFSINSIIMSQYDYIFNMEGFYMKTKLTYTTINEIKERGKIARTLIKSFDPDFIYTTDDNAFRYVAIPMSKLGYRILFSGINKPFKEYMKLFPDINPKNFCGAEEIINLHPFFKLMDEMGIIFNKVYIITNSMVKMSITSRYKYKNFIRELDKTMYKNKIVNLVSPTLSILVDNLKRIQKDPRGLIIVCIHRIYDDLTGKELGKKSIIKTIITINKKHLELDISEHFVRYGLSFSCAPSFYNMGETAAKFLTNFLLTGQWGHNCIRHSKSIMTMNEERIKQLGLFQLFKNYKDRFNKTFEKIEPYPCPILVIKKLKEKKK